MQTENAVTVQYEILDYDFVRASQLATHGRSLWPKVRLWLFRILGVGFLLTSLLFVTQPGQRAFGSMMLCYAIFLCFWSSYTKWNFGNVIVIFERR